MAVPSISPFVLWFFRRVARRYFRRAFHAVRIGEAEVLASLGDGPLIVYGNHSSWWDPLVLVLLAKRYMPLRRHYAPMDAVSLARYGILRRIGVFPVELDSARGGAQFLRTGLDILAAGGVLWVTPQGRFADVREPKLEFKPGLAALAARVPGGCTVVPLAIEYVFWDERLPETLLQLGEPVKVQGQSAAELDEVLRARLARTMGELKERAMARDARAFEVLQRGTLGSGGYYEFGQRMLAWMRGRAYEPEHSRISAAAASAVPGTARRPEEHAR